jgi:hypothetical protein
VWGAISWVKLGQAEGGTGGGPRLTQSPRAAGEEERNTDFGEGALGEDAGDADGALAAIDADTTHFGRRARGRAGGAGALT